MVFEVSGLINAEQITNMQKMFVTRNRSSRDAAGWQAHNLVATLGLLLSTQTLTS